MGLHCLERFPENKIVLLYLTATFLAMRGTPWQAAAMWTFPAEFADLLSRRGRRVLAGADSALCGALADPRRRFLAAAGLVDARQARAARGLLDRALLAHLSPLAQPIPPESIWDMEYNYEEWLPKTARMHTAYLENRRGAASKAAEETGLAPMLRSESFRAFATALAGRALKRRHGIQVLCYGPGDYAGPHNDHHPEEPAAARGYLDVHVSLASPAVEHQWLVWARAGHFTEIADVATAGGVTAYRLPFWHYTTPLVARPGLEAKARRWVLLGTFLYGAPPSSATRPAADGTPPASRTARA